MEALIFIIGTAAVAGGWYWLWRSNNQAQQQMASAMGFEIVARGAEERRPDPVLGRQYQRLIMTGSIEGRRAEVWSRIVYSAGGKRAPATVLALPLAVSGEMRLRIQPARLGRMLAVFGGDQPYTPTGDVAFDRVFRVTSTDAETPARLLTPELRSELLAFQQQITRDMPDSAAGRVAGEFLMGTFELEPGRVHYAVPGTASETIAEHLKLVAPLLVTFATHVEATFVV
ncbi:MAG: hypothetical protein SNJ69_07585 [Chloroflexaceae bacterium]